MKRDEKIRVVHRYIEAFDKGDLDILRDLFAASGTVEDPVGTEPHIGHENVLAFYQTGMDMGVKLELTGEPRCAGNTVCFPFKAVFPDYVIDIIDVFEFDGNGKITSMKAYWGKENLRRATAK